MTYRRNLKTTVKCLEFSMVILIFPIICHFANRYFGDFIDVRIIWFFSIATTLISGLLCIDYFVNSTSGTVILGTDHIEISNASEQNIFDSNEVNKAIVYGAPSVYRKSFFRLLPFEAFHYVDILLKNGKIITITSLSDYELYWNLINEPILKDKLFLCKGGWFKKGELINSIWLNRQK